ncbi:leucyl aminopeptidase family protein [Phaeobacter sp. QD34_3]|uniref:leucyl aminopeptidase family protein n=1 Tax=unclassified Phaeobacter TaxID=2621772 RepID=UPI00237FBDB1|nr:MULTISPECIES: leucyl aminopeptidase family protein [unclassified Phaeobacter]MDE4133463.1 leucyl aminopeptidase family protein [Phaeobacter sp. QD34_3]MDE4137099.1 leucyl aminopeptidase family protein [Phaeobacter sp. QD34_24]MDE4175297.1 leucyl aminopeptidase family protein [Phaeobacter sp. PT47_59]
MPPVFAAPCDLALSLHIVDQDSCADWLQSQPARVAQWAQANGFRGAIGQVLIVPGEDTAAPAMALAGYGTALQRARRRFVLAAAAEKLPEGTYRLAGQTGENTIPQDQLAQECFGWLMSDYRFDRYKEVKGSGAALIAPEGIDATAIESLVAAECLTRDLINTPAADMGPDQLQAAAEGLAQDFGARTEVTLDEALLSGNFPMIHAVGRAAAARPRLIDMRWGDTGPKLTLVGKGVCFDTGGLNLKPGASMGLMKKDMGGSATVLGLARMIMAAGLPVQLRVLIPAVENAVSGNAFRPGDILTSRKGLTVEINNTDAEGRLVLADALTLASEDDPDLLISMATLTGAARVAVGPDLAPFYAGSDADAAAIAGGAARMADPVWRMPFHAPYEEMIEPGIADLDNAPSGGFAGSITAALFLRRFAGETRYMHFDIYGWTPNAAPARPKGGVGQGARAIFAALPGLLDL